MQGAQFVITVLTSEMLLSDFDHCNVPQCSVSSDFIVPIKIAVWRGLGS